MRDFDYGDGDGSGLTVTVKDYSQGLGVGIINKCWGYWLRVWDLGSGWVTG